RGLPRLCLRIADLGLRGDLLFGAAGHAPASIGARSPPRFGGEKGRSDRRADPRGGLSRPRRLDPYLGRSLGALLRGPLRSLPPVPPAVSRLWPAARPRPRRSRSLSLPALRGSFRDGPKRGRGQRLRALHPSLAWPVGPPDRKSVV